MLPKRYPPLSRQSGPSHAKAVDLQQQLLLDALTTAGRKTGSRSGFMVLSHLHGGEPACFYTFNGRHSTVLTAGEITED